MSHRLARLLRLVGIAVLAIGSIVLGILAGPAWGG